MRNHTHKWIQSHALQENLLGLIPAYRWKIATKTTFICTTNTSQWFSCEQNRYESIVGICSLWFCYLPKGKNPKSRLHFVRKKCWLAAQIISVMSQYDYSIEHGFQTFKDVTGVCVCVWMVIENKIVQMVQLINHSIRKSIENRVKRV